MSVRRRSNLPPVSGFAPTRDASGRTHTDLASVLRIGLTQLPATSSVATNDKANDAFVPVGVTLTPPQNDPSVDPDDHTHIQNHLTQSLLTGDVAHTVHGDHQEFAFVTPASASCSCMSCVSNRIAANRLTIEA